MAGLGQEEPITDSRRRERRLESFAHWDEILIRLQHRWPVRRVVRWHAERFPGAPCPPKSTLARYVKGKPSSWFISRLVLAESGTRMAQRLLVAEQQAEMIESMKMRIARALEFEASMNGLLIPEVRHNYEALGRMLVDHFRVQQELGLEGRAGSMAPAGAQFPGTGPAVERAFVQKLVELPSDAFVGLLHRHFEDRRAKAPLQHGEVIEVEAVVRNARDHAAGAPAD